MSSRSPTTVRRRRLGIELRGLREAAGLTIEQVAERLEYSISKISRIENAQVSATPGDVQGMLEVYEVSDSRRDELVQLAREARHKGWWYDYRDLPKVPLSALETEAEFIFQFSALIIPALLQTRDYARAILEGIRLDLHGDEIDRRLEFRAARQAMFTRDDPPTYWVVLDQAALHRWVGDRETMKAQLQYLRTAATSPNITLQVLPFSAGAHVGMDGEFTILRFAEPSDPDIIYVENAQGDLYLDDSNAIRRYNWIFDHLRAAAMNPVESSKFLTNVAEEL
jgi:transcriptional regulator with XRE-family HTH domain